MIFKLSWTKSEQDLKEANFDLKDREIEWTLEFVRRVIERQILPVFDNDLEKCKTEIEKMMKERSVFVCNPNEGYTNQHWCLMELPKLGLTKIPIDATSKKIVVITIANPVTDHRCQKVFYRKFPKNKKRYLLIS
jgi:hypothetical protein